MGTFISNMEKTCVVRILFLEGVLFNISNMKKMYLLRIFLFFEADSFIKHNEDFKKEAQMFWFVSGIATEVSTVRVLWPYIVMKYQSWPLVKTNERRTTEKPRIFINYLRCLSGCVFEENIFEYKINIFLNIQLNNLYTYWGWWIFVLWN